MSVWNRVASVLPMVGYAVVPVVCDRVIDAIYFVVGKFFPKSDPFDMRKWGLASSTLVGAVLIWKSPVNRIPAAVVYAAYKVWDLWQFYHVDCEKRRETIARFFSVVSENQAASIATYWDKQPYLFRSTNDQGKNALHVAVEKGHMNVIHWMTRAGLFSELNVPSRNRWKPLHLAVQKGNLECVKYVYEQDKSALHETVHGGGDLFAIAAKENHVKIVEWLVGTDDHLGRLANGRPFDLFDRALEACETGTQVIEWIYTNKIIKDIEWIYTNKITKDAEKGCALGNAMGSALKNNNLNVAEWVKVKDPALGTFLEQKCQKEILAATQQGHIKILEWVYAVSQAAIKNNGPALMRVAIQHGRKEIAEWLYGIDSTLITGLGNEVLKGVHPTMSQWVTAKLLGGV
jgi:hypothetical protein